MRMKKVFFGGTVIGYGAYRISNNKHTSTHLWQNSGCRTESNCWSKLFTFESARITYEL